MLESLLGPDALGALATVILVNVVLSGDNAIVVGMAAADLPPRQRHRAVLLGIGIAAILRVVLSLFATQLLGIIGLTLAGGVLLAWVAWKMWRELRDDRGAEERDAEAALDGTGTEIEVVAAAASDPKSLGDALMQIIIADVSMSLDNVLAVAGAARDNLPVLVIGLVLSVLLMAVASTFIAHLISRHRWIAYVGLAAIVFVAIRMIWDGTHEVARAVGMV